MTRQLMNLIANKVGLTPSGYVNDSALWERIKYLLKNSTAVSGVAATGVFTSSGAIGNNETVTIGSVVYRFRSTLAQAYDVKIGGTDAITLDNLKHAINASGTAGTHYFAGTHAHPQVTATTNTDTAQTVEVRYTHLLAVATTETCANCAWGGATVSGGTAGIIAPAASDVAAVSGGR